MGDNAAFERLYRQCSPRLYGICLQLLREGAEAEDVVQETFIRIWHSAGDYHEERGSPLNWMITIARYRCLDHLRRQQVDLRARSGLVGTDNDQPGPLDMSQMLSQSRLLDDCIGKLEERQRTSILMAYFHGLSHGQLARRMGKPLGTVKSWIRRGMMDLRRCIEA